MTKSVAAIALALPLALLAAVPAIAAGPAKPAPSETIFGIWSRDGHEEQLEFFDCAGKLCAKGTLPLPDGSPAPLVLRNAAKAGPNQWKGDLFNPENGKTYGGKITLDSKTQLTLTGCLIAFLCQSETWTRVSDAPAAAAGHANDKAAPAGAGHPAPAAAVHAPDKAAPAKTPPAKPPAAAH